MFSSSTLSNRKQKLNKTRSLAMTRNLHEPQAANVSTSNFNSDELSKYTSLKWFAALIYILSGATQPLLVTLVKISGLGDHMCQLYMLMYYIGPAMVSFTLCLPSHGGMQRVSSKAVLKASAIALIDVVAQTVNYTGATWAGPTIFAIIYSSVTIWTALYSRILLGRRLSLIQCIGILVVFGGLALTAIDSVAVGPDVFKGSLLIIFGSSFHAMTYVLSEAIMTDGEQLTPQMNCAIQGGFASFMYLCWQLIYTRNHFQERVMVPMNAAGTSIPKAICVLSSLAVSNLIHALSFFYTLKHYPGGATSAGVMKGLQAVLVFIFTSVVYCGWIGGDEMCFSAIKFVSLIVVIGGVAIFTVSTNLNGSNQDTRDANKSLLPTSNGYTVVGNA